VGIPQNDKRGGVAFLDPGYGPLRWYIGRHWCGEMEYMWRDRTWHSSMCEQAYFCTEEEALIWLNPERILLELEL
jgi:hypothetical protein